MVGVKVWSVTLADPESVGNTSNNEKVVVVSSVGNSNCLIVKLIPSSGVKVLLESKSTKGLLNPEPDVWVELFEPAVLLYINVPLDPLAPPFIVIFKSSDIPFEHHAPVTGQSL